jgi:hypothetical protein
MELVDDVVNVAPRRNTFHVGFLYIWGYSWFWRSGFVIASAEGIEKCQNADKKN